MELIVFVGALFATLVGYIGDQKGRSFPLWALAGFLFGVFALVAVCAVPKIVKGE